jgi:nucleotide-binding universal stress UspA family protein
LNTFKNFMRSTQPATADISAVSTGCRAAFIDTVGNVSDQPCDGPSVVLVAIDGSDTSMRAGAYAAGIARRQNARLVCLYVRPFSAVAGMGAAAVTSMQQAHDDVVRELRQSIETQGARIGIRAELVERDGSPFTEIVRLADELRADAVIVGASTKAGHRFIGALAVHLVRASRWPVTVVP